MQTCETCGNNWCQARQRCSNDGCVTRVVRADGSLSGGGFLYGWRAAMTDLAREDGVLDAARERQRQIDEINSNLRTSWRTVSEAEQF